MLGVVYEYNGKICIWIAFMAAVLGFCNISQRLSREWLLKEKMEYFRSGDNTREATYILEASLFSTN
jgi:hypothetical protein